MWPAVVTAFVLFGLAIGPAAPSRPSSPYGYPWHGRVPVTITITDHTSSAWRTLLVQSAADWSLSGVVQVVLTNSDGTCDAKAKATVCDGYYGLGNVHPAWTVIDTRNGYMADAAVYINDSYMDGYFNVDGVWFPPYTPDQRAHIVCHEMSHLLGVIAGDGCTDASGWRTHPTATDYGELLSIYSSDGR